MEITFFTPYKSQIPIVQACLRPYNGLIEYIVVNASRQSGKTLLASNVAIYWALKETKQTIMIVSPTDSQVKKIYKQILNAIVTSGLIKSSKIQSGDSEIIFNNGSQILFRSAASTNSLRGNTCTHLILDECAFIDEETFTTILSPTLTVKGKKVLFCSTPKGKNYFYKLFMDGSHINNTTALSINLKESIDLKDSIDSNQYSIIPNKSGHIYSFCSTYKDNPYANLDFIEQQRKTIPDAIFRQEYLAEFIDAGSIFKDVEKNCTIIPRTNPIPNERYFFGIDLAFSETGDFTVISIFNDKSEQVMIERFRGTSNEVQIEKIIELVRRFSPVKVLVETNNIGASVLSQLINKGIYNAEGFTTTSSSKNQLINEFSYALESGKIKLLNNSDLIEEFNAFSFKLTKKGSVQFMASSGFHDDIVMATLISYNCMKNNKYYGELIYD